MSMEAVGNVAPTGKLGLRVLRGPASDYPTDLHLKDIQQYGYPQKNLPSEVNIWRSHNVRTKAWRRGLRDWAIAAMAKKAGLCHVEGMLFGKVIRANGEELDLGLMGLNIVTTTGVGFIGDAFRNSVELETMKYHGLGTGSTGELVGNTALQTELTTEYASDNNRPAGTLAGSANVYTTVGSNTVDSGVNLREWGLFSQTANSGGVMLDRVTFASVNLSSGDTLQTTFSLTLPAGG
jgi:hypothetical protein